MESIIKDLKLGLFLGLQNAPIKKSKPLTSARGARLEARAVDKAAECSKPRMESYKAS